MDEGKSPFVPGRLRARDPGAGLAAIDWYAAHGYRQLKLYNSIRPEWVKPMVTALGCFVGNAGLHDGGPGRRRPATASCTTSTRVT